jgi:hypothetical protein
MDKRNTKERRRRTYAALGTLSVLAVTISACAVGTDVNFDELAVGSDQEDTHETHSNLWIDASKIWSNPSIPVCWVTGGFATEKGWVKDEISKTWHVHTGARFTGWGSCPADMSTFSGVAITIDNEMVVRNGLGQQSDGISEMELDFREAATTKYTTCIDNSLDRQACVRSVSIHEFGHVLSFPHEHNRSDRGPECTTAIAGSMGDTFVTNYDPQSIMNYCFSAVLPSALDIVGAEVAYPKGNTLSVSCKNGCFAGSSTLFSRTNGTVQNEWTARGARDWWVSSPVWKKGSTTLGTGATLAATKLSAGANAITYSATNKYSTDTSSGAGSVKVDNAAWASIVTHFL